MRILLADDDPKIHVVVRLWLNRAGHEVVSVHNGQDGLTQLEEGNFDGLITDVNMPLLSGIELAKAAVELRDPPLLVVVLTSRCDLGYVEEAVGSSQVYLFNKPFSPAVLAEWIENWQRERVESS